MRIIGVSTRSLLQGLICVKHLVLRLAERTRYEESLSPPSSIRPTGPRLHSPSSLPPTLTCLTGACWAGGRWARLSGAGRGAGALERKGRLGSRGCCALGRGKGAPWGAAAGVAEAGLGMVRPEQAGIDQDLLHISLDINYIIFLFLGLGFHGQVQQ